MHCGIDEITASSRREFAPESFLGCYAIWNQINYLQQRDQCLSCCWDPGSVKRVLFIIVSYKWQSREESGDFTDPNTRV